MRNIIRKIYRIIIPIIFSKSNYKYFLKSDFFLIEERIQKIITSIDFFSYYLNPVIVQPPFGKRILVIAPHHDDEMIGCGGSLLLQRRHSSNLQIIYVYSGGDEYKQLGFSSFNDLVLLREVESNKVCKDLNIQNPIFLRKHKDDSIDEISNNLYDKIISINPDTIFSPFILDNNQEHQITAFALAKALEKTSMTQRIINYEVWGLCISNVIVKIDDVIHDKIRLLGFYESQIKGTDYVNSVVGLNMYHSRTFGSEGGKFAEKFFELPAHEYCKLYNRILDK